MRSTPVARARLPIAPLIAALSMAWCLVSSPSFAQNKDKPATVDEQARKLVFEGLDAYRVGNFAAAEAAYQAAWELKRGFDVAASLGEAELRLGKYHEAAEHLAYAVKNVLVTTDPKKKAVLQKLLDEARAKVGEVNVTVNIDRAQVFVDGVLVGVAPLELPIFVTPGNHTIEAKRDGYTMAAQSITATTGSTQKAQLVLDKVPTAPDKTATSPATAIAPPPAPADTRDRTAVLVVGSATPCEELQDTLDRRDRFATLGIVGLGVGVGTGAATLIYALAGGLATPGTTSSGSLGNQLQALPTFMARGGGLTFTGRW